MVSVDEFIGMFDEADRYAAAIVMTEGLSLIVQKETADDREYLVNKPTEDTYFVYNEELGDNFRFESGVSMYDAMEFCEYFNFKYEVRSK
jgi:hypothetical protein